MTDAEQGRRDATQLPAELEAKKAARLNMRGDSQQNRVAQGDSAASTDAHDGHLDALKAQRLNMRGN